MPILRHVAGQPGVFSAINGVLTRGSHCGEYHHLQRPPAMTGSGDQTGTIGFWANSNGLNLITALGTDKSGNSLLGKWLAAQFPNLFGSLSKATPNGVWNYNPSLFNTTTTPSWRLR
jgi:hypothetical protein